ncbi:hypothetical protein [Andreprevotia chitinilytica]|uniref:hypothetical protein n=1 Tax=Andreprevotia chitinilytica TaxID=396808 RepID=UPI00068BFAB4|nr:hypothetical protein [Andreprevotia chitinilytica]
MKSALFPIALIVIGAGWLVSELHLLPEADWIVIFGLIAGGIAVLVVDGVNAQSVVVGPLLIGTGAMVFAHEHNGISWSVLLPVLLILWGLLLLVARMPGIPPASTRRQPTLPGRWKEDDDSHR